MAVQGQMCLIGVDGDSYLSRPLPPGNSSRRETIEDLQLQTSFTPVLSRGGHPVELASVVAYLDSSWLVLMDWNCFKRYTTSLETEVI